MLLPLSAAAVAAVAYGAAALLQAVAARREPQVHGVDPSLLLRMLRHPEFAAALALNAGGFVLHVIAVRGLPLFLAQVVISSSVAVTALLGVRVLHVHLTRSALAAVVAVCAGLASLTASASATGTAQPDTRARAGLLAAVVAVAVLGSVAARIRGPAGASLLGLAAGLGFGVVAVAARVLPDLRPAALVADPAAYALVAAGVTGFHFYSSALQRGGVLTATSAMTVAQTVGPAVVGLLALGDQVRPGAVPGAVAGLVLAVAGVAVLAWFDEQALGPAAPAAPEPPSRGAAPGPRRRLAQWWHPGEVPSRPATRPGRGGAPG